MVHLCSGVGVGGRLYLQRKMGPPRASCPGGAGASAMVITHRTSTRTLMPGSLTAALGWDLSKGKTGKVKLCKCIEGERQRGERKQATGVDWGGGCRLRQEEVA